MLETFQSVKGASLLTMANSKNERSANGSRH